MTPSVRLTAKEVRVLAEHLERYGAARDTPLGKIGLKLAAPKRKPSRRRPACADHQIGLVRVCVEGETKKELAHARRQDIRTAVFLRAGGACECGCGEQIRDDRKDGGCFPEARGEVDHFFGRGAGRLPESEQTCWVLRPACHREKTLNRPDAATWCRKFANHAERHGFLKEARHARARQQFVETRARLPAAPEAGS